jgi:hypothetical protein
MKRFNLIAATLFAFISCNNTQEKATEATNKPNSTENQKVDSSSLLSFQAILQMLKNDPNIKIFDTCNKFPGQPYVICYMQLHNLDPVFPEIYTKSIDKTPDETTDDIQQEILNSIKKFRNYRIFYEGFMRENGRIVYVKGLNQGKMSNPSILDKYISDNLESLNIFGIEDWAIQGKINARLAFDDIFYRSVDYFYNTLKTEEERKKFIHNFVMGFEQVFNPKELHLQELSLDPNNDPAFLRAYEDEIYKIINDVISMRAKAGDSPGGWAKVFIDLTDYSKAQKSKIVLQERNIDIVKNLPSTANSVLILGAGHFLNLYKKEKGYISFDKNFAIGKLLYEKNLNYIILSPKSFILE